MSNIRIERIKFGTQEFDLIAAGVNLGESGGTIAFLKGSASFESIEAALKENGSIVQIGLSGEPDWTRSDLVYAGKLAKQSDQVIGTAEDGVTSITADVITATFRTPDLTETVKEQAAEIKSLRATVDTLVLSSLEG
ncbi:hypothetical protein [Lacrimispora indolis]|uniref:hypothetical protein n=1 Tax=Lacrimispora indolis TaxID=69825 RepID=UPI00045EB784|nr:hypothetical protein [Lacrimispora indolis]